MKQREKMRFPFFWVIYLILTGAFIVFWFKTVGLVREQLVVYEECQPEHLAEQVVKRIESGDYSGMAFESAGSRFEDADVYKNDYILKLAGKKLSFSESDAGYDLKAPVYDVKMNGEVVARIGLKEVSSEPLMFILSKQEWKLDYVQPVYEIHNESVAFKVPDSCRVYVNGIELSESEKTNETASYEACKYASEYVRVPVEVNYYVSGLSKNPTVVITNSKGDEIVPKTEGNQYTVELPDILETSEIPEDLKKMVLKNAKDWTNFFSRDLEGCRESVDCLKHIFTEDSYYLTLADNYRLHDMWMYSSHTEPVFKNEKVTNYTVYGDDFFTAEVYFEKSMYLKTKVTRVDVTHSTHTYVRVNGEWRIADMFDIMDTE